MAVKELSKVNYNGTEYQIIDATAESKFSPIGHEHLANEIAGLVPGVYYVEGTQTASTGSWTGTLSDISALTEGMTIAYYLPVAGNGAATLDLTLAGNNTTGALPVYYTGSSQTTTHYAANSVILLTYAKNGWRHADYNTNTNSLGDTWCGTGSATAAKAATHTHFYLKDNDVFLFTLRYGNTAKSALTLDINSQGAIPIYINGEPSSATNYTLPRGTYLVRYTGQYYDFRTDDRVPLNIEGDASSVNGYTVLSNVPADAEFTDTTYTVCTSAGLSLSASNEISIGTLPVSHGGTGTTSLASGEVLIGNGTNAVTTRGIDTTTGGTAGSTSLITSGAVYTALDSKSNDGHTHTVSDISNLVFDYDYDRYTNPVATLSTVTTMIAEITASSLGLSQALKFIGFATSTMSDGQTTTPAISGIASGYTPEVGHVVIDKDSHYEYVYTSANKWERLGADDSYVVAGTEISFTPTGTIGNTGTVTNYTPTGTINAQTFYGTPATIEVTGSPEGSIAITTTTTGTKNYTPAGSVTATFYGSATSGTISGSTEGIAVGTHTFTPAGSIAVGTVTAGTPKNYTPSGTVSITGQPSKIEVTGKPGGSVTITSTTSGTKNYTPGGSVTSAFTGTAGTVNVSGTTANVAVSAHTYTPGGSISVSTSGTTNYTPSGTISLAGDITGTPEGSVTITVTNSGTKNYTPTGTIGSTFSGTAGTVNVSGSTTGVAVSAHSFTPTGTVGTSVTPSTATVSVVTDVGDAPSLTMTVSNEILSWTWNEGSVPTVTKQTVVYGISSATSTFYGSSSNLTHTVDQGTVSASGSFTPSGTITSTFYGAGVVVKGSFSGQPSSFTFTNGDLTTKTFYGTPVRIAFSGTQSTLSHTVDQGNVSASGTFTPQGAVTSTFSGTAVRLVGSFSGESFTSEGTWPTLGATFYGGDARLNFTGTQTTLAHNVDQGTVSGNATFTPTGTIGAKFTGTGVSISGSFSGEGFVSTGSFTPTGTIQQATFTGSGAKLNFIGSVGTITLSSV